MTHIIKEGFKVSTLSDGSPMQVEIELTNDEWIDLIDHQEPDQLGICCGIISDIRDIFIDAIREGRSIPVYKLKDLHDLALCHEPWNEYDDDALDNDDIVWRLVRLWRAIRDEAKAFGPGTANPDDPKDALDTVVSTGRGICFEMLAMESRPHCILLQIAQMWPFLKTLHDKIEQLAPHSMDLWAAYDEEGGIVSTVAGPAIYPTEEAVDKTLEVNSKHHDRNFKKKRVRISAKGGIEILADPEPWERAGTVILEAKEAQILGEQFGPEQAKPMYIVEFPDCDGEPVECSIAKDEFRGFPHDIRNGTHFGIVTYRKKVDDVVSVVAGCWPVSKLWHPDLRDPEARLRKAMAAAEKLLAGNS